MSPRLFIFVKMIPSYRQFSPKRTFCTTQHLSCVSKQMKAAACLKEAPWPRPRASCLTLHNSIPADYQHFVWELFNQLLNQRLLSVEIKSTIQHF